MIALCLVSSRYSLPPAIPVRNADQAPVLQRLHQQGAHPLLQLGQREVPALPGGRYAGPPTERPLTHPPLTSRHTNTFPLGSLAWSQMHTFHWMLIIPPVITKSPERQTQIKSNMNNPFLNTQRKAVSTHTHTPHVAEHDSVQQQPEPVFVSRSQAGPEEGALHLHEEERQEGGEGCPAGWLRGRDVCLPSWRGVDPRLLF